MNGAVPTVIRDDVTEEAPLSLGRVRVSNDLPPRSGCFTANMDWVDYGAAWMRETSPGVVVRVDW